MELIQPGDRRRAALDKIRADRERVLADVEAMAQARLSPDEALQRLLARLQDDADRAQQRVLAFARPDVAPDAPPIDAGFLLWLDPKAFEAQLRAKLKSLLPASAPSLASRPAAVEKLKARLIELEKLEEREVLKLERAGLMAERRADANVALLLAVWDEADAAAA